MSSTGRNKKENAREENDFYATPYWAVHRLLEKVSLPCDGHWLEPSAGEGSIVRSVNSYKGKSSFFNHPARWELAELQEIFLPILQKESDDVFIGDFLQYDYKKHGSSGKKADVCIGNPPYNIALSIIKHALTQAGIVCMLLRISFLASGKRAKWMQSHPPDIFVLPNRPSFKGKGTDSADYAWFVWSNVSKRNSGLIQILNLTSKEERLKGKKESIRIIENYRTISRKL